MRGPYPIDVFAAARLVAPYMMSVVSSGVGIKDTTEGHINVIRPEKLVINAKDEYYMRIAESVAQGSTCRRRAVGAVAIDAHGRIVATGYNGVVRKDQHCTEVPCGYEHNAKGFCMAIHAEANMLMHAHDTFTISTVYTTCAPCIHCAKLVANTPCKRVVYRQDYTPDSLLFLTNRGVECVKLNEGDDG